MKLQYSVKKYIKNLCLIKKHPIKRAAFEPYRFIKLNSFVRYVLLFTKPDLFQTLTNGHLSFFNNTCTNQNNIFFLTIFTTTFFCCLIFARTTSFILCNNFSKGVFRPWIFSITDAYFHKIIQQFVLFLLSYCSRRHKNDVT